MQSECRRPRWLTLTLSALTEMLQTQYMLTGPERDVILRGESVGVLEATNSFVENVSETNPARMELLEQIRLMKESIQKSRDCEITEQKHGYLRDVMTNLFDQGAAELIRGDRVYTIEMVKKES